MLINSTIYIVPPDVVSISIETTNGTAGNDTSIFCVASGHPLPEITWFKNEDLITVQDELGPDKISVFVSDSSGNRQSELYIQDLVLEDEGEYRCNASNDLVEKRSDLSDTVSLQVHCKLLKELITF